MKNHTLLVFVAGVIAFGSLRGMATQVSGADSATSRAQAIPASAVAGSAGETLAKLQGIQSAIMRASDVGGIRLLWAVLADSLHHVVGDSGRGGFEQASLKQLKDQRVVWVRNKRRVESWRDSLLVRTEFLEGQGKILEEMKTRWEETRAIAVRDTFPGSLKGRIDTVLSTIDTTVQVLRTRPEAALVLLQEVSDGSVAIGNYLGGIDDAIDRSVGKLFVQDSPPLWEAMDALAAVGISGGVLDINRGLASAVAYLNDRRGKLLIEIGVFVILFLFLQSLRKWVGHTLSKEDEHLSGGLLTLLRHPVAIALMLVLFLIRLFFPSAPSAVYDCAALLMLVPVLLVVRELLHPNFRPALYGLGGFFFLHRLHLLTPEQTEAFRLLTFVIAILGLVGLLLARTRRSVWSNLAPAGWQNTIILAGRVTAVAFVASVTANVFGYNALAEALLFGTLNTAYSVVAFLAATVVMEGIGVLALKTPAARGVRFIRSHEAHILRQWVRLIRFLAVVGLSATVLANFSLLDPCLRLLGGILDKRWSFGSLHVSIGSLGAFVLTIWGAVMIARLITLILDEDIFPRMEMRRGVASMLSTMTRYAIVTVGFVFAAGIAGIEMTQIALLVSALGVGIGFGLQGLVSNIVAGLILIFERPINPGDTIEFGSRMGTVGQIGPRASVVHGFDGSEIIVPNSALISSEVVNYTLTDRRRRVEIPVGVAYGSNPGAVADLLVSAVQKTTGVLSSPEPLALFQGFGASSLDFIVRFWVADFDTALPTRSDAAMAIYRALEEKGIQIPFPQRDLHLRLTQPGSEVPEGGREDRAEPRRRPRNRNK